MNKSWKAFLFCQFPIAALVLALAAQGLAIFLSDVPMWRDRTDELALAVTRDSTNYRILLFGDSTTRNATARFSLGAPGEVANLATNAYIGLAGSLFLLQRYLKAHSTPQYVVIAMAPAMYHYENDASIARYHLWHTFNQPDERTFLSTYVSGIELRDRFPAILDVQERIVEPLFSFLKHRYVALRRKEVPPIEAGALKASTDAPVEYAMHGEPDATDKTGFRKRDLSVAPINAQSLSRVCDLSSKYGFRVDIVWSPVPADLEIMFNSDGALAELEAKIRSIMDGRCDFNGFADFNKIRTYPTSSFHRDMLHLFGDGWEQRYASDVREYLYGLLHRPSMEAASRNHSMGVAK